MTELKKNDIRKVGKKIAYGDPPYPGQAKRHYSNDPSGIPPEEVDSAELLKKLLRDYDGFALSTSEPGLLIIMDDLPKGFLRENKIRLAPWVKMWAHFRPFVDVQYAHEYVLFKSVRAKGSRPSVRDHLVCNPTRKKGTHGAKPDQFCDWILDLLGYDPEYDTIDDLYPGSGAFTEAVNRRKNMVKKKIDLCVDVNDDPNADEGKELYELAKLPPLTETQLNEQAKYRSMFGL